MGELPESAIGFMGHKGANRVFVIRKIVGLGKGILPCYDIDPSRNDGEWEIIPTDELYTLIGLNPYLDRCIEERLRLGVDRNVINMEDLEKEFHLMNKLL